MANNEDNANNHDPLEKRGYGETGMTYGKGRYRTPARVQMIIKTSVND